ncbi:hypothetical protein [Adhaeribacter terreus]|uniref:Uncharacterized protein n=1 Tax=Adhaeribacter terreus TaxID=529703 RepID=A0ABW0EAG8_9BACT
MKSKKAEEKYIIENHFFKRFSDLYFRNSITETIKAEAPDFLVKTKDNLVGVEVRQICIEKATNEKYSLVEKYSFENQIIEKTQQIFNSRNNIPLNIRFDFVNEFKLSKDQISIPAIKFCSIIEEHTKNKSLNEHFNFSIEEDLPKELNKISGYFFPEINESVWYSGKSMFLPNLSQEQIKTAIIDKEKKAPSYRKQADDLILLLVEGIPPYSWFDKIEKVNFENFTSCFDKIFIIRNLSNELVQIK